MKPKNKSLQAKSNARLAAVQLLYRNAMTPDTLSVERLLNEYESYKTGDKDNARQAGMGGIPPHLPTLKALLIGVTSGEDTLMPLIEEHLSFDWKKERMNPLALIILKLGCFELDAHRELSTAVIIDEYTTLAQRFLGDEEIGFTHAVLQKLAEKFRK